MSHHLRIYKYESSFEDTFVIEAGDDKTAAEYVISKYKHLMKKHTYIHTYIQLLSMS